jgi:hypothetical protein
LAASHSAMDACKDDDDDDEEEEDEEKDVEAVDA